MSVSELIVRRKRTLIVRCELMVWERERGVQSSSPRRNSMSSACIQTVASLGGGGGPPPGDTLWVTKNYFFCGWIYKEHWINDVGRWEYGEEISIKRSSGFLKDKNRPHHQLPPQYKTYRAGWRTVLPCHAGIRKPSDTDTRSSATAKSTARPSCL